ncbi:hypothetical protein FOA52_008169 [Chlamydomonas sp. UWO 241]|nr:hypothetical protein FOA52_008169 [Chlamydomonas sp. UWO 241]
MSGERPDLPPATSGLAHDAGGPHSSEQRPSKRPREEGGDAGVEQGDQQHHGGVNGGAPPEHGGDVGGTGAPPPPAAAAPASNLSGAGAPPPPAADAPAPPAGLGGAMFGDADAAGVEAAMAAAADMLAGADHAAAAAITAFLADPAAAAAAMADPNNPAGVMLAQLGASMGGGADSSFSALVAAAVGMAALEGGGAVGGEAGGVFDGAGGAFGGGDAGVFGGGMGTGLFGGGFGGGAVGGDGGGGMGMYPIDPALLQAAQLSLAGMPGLPTDPLELAALLASLAGPMDQALVVHAGSSGNAGGAHQQQQQQQGAAGPSRGTAKSRKQQAGDGAAAGGDRSGPANWMRRFHEMAYLADKMTLDDARNAINMMTIHVEWSNMPEAMRETLSTAPAAVEVPANATLSFLRRTLCRLLGGHLNPDSLRIADTQLLLPDDAAVDPLLSSYGICHNTLLSMEATCGEIPHFGTAPPPNQSRTQAGYGAGALSVFNNASAASRIGTKERFTLHEMYCLVEGMEMHGLKWAKIHKDWGKELENKTQGDLKDKWRNWQRNVANGWQTARVTMPDDLKARVEKMVAEHAVPGQQQGGGGGVRMLTATSPGGTPDGMGGMGAEGAGGMMDVAQMAALLEAQGLDPSQLHGMGADALAAVAAHLQAAGVGMNAYPVDMATSNAYPAAMAAAEALAAGALALSGGGGGGAGGSGAGEGGGPGGAEHGDAVAAAAAYVMNYDPNVAAQQHQAHLEALMAQQQQQQQ